MAGSSSILIGRSRVRFGPRPTRPSPAATTSPATTGCAISSAPSGSTLDSYISIEGWAFQGLRSTDKQERIPIALPAIDARFRLDDPVLGGKVELQANSLAILRIEGQDTQRAFASARWDLRRLTSMGQELTLTAFARADAYHTDEADETTVDIYRGKNGWQFRGIGALAADMQMAVGRARCWAARSGCTPRVQLVAVAARPRTSTFPTRMPARSTLRTAICSRSIASPATTAGRTDRASPTASNGRSTAPNGRSTAVIGQSYRLSREPSIFPDGTGPDRPLLGHRRPHPGAVSAGLIDLTHRFRLDKDNLALRRNEIDLTVGSDLTYVQVGYLRLNRDIISAIEDLRDKEELRLAGRWQFTATGRCSDRPCSTSPSKEEDPLSLADGFEPVRHRAGHQL